MRSFMNVGCCCGDPVDDVIITQGSWYFHDDPATHDILTDEWYYFSSFVGITVNQSINTVGPSAGQYHWRTGAFLRWLSSGSPPAIPLGKTILDILDEDDESVRYYSFLMSSPYPNGGARPEADTSNLIDEAINGGGGDPEITLHLFDAMFPLAPNSPIDYPTPVVSRVLLPTRRADLDGTYEHNGFTLLRMFWEIELDLVLLLNDWNDNGQSGWWFLEPSWNFPPVGQATWGEGLGTTMNLDLVPVASIVQQA